MTLTLKMDHAWPCLNASNISIFIKQTENQLNHNLLCAQKEEMQKRIQHYLKETEEPYPKSIPEAPTESLFPNLYEIE